MDFQAARLQQQMQQMQQMQQYAQMVQYGAGIRSPSLGPLSSAQTPMPVGPKLTDLLLLVEEDLP